VPSPGSAPALITNKNKPPFLTFFTVAWRGGVL
jgi:hypothetical protein